MTGDGGPTASLRGVRVVKGWSCNAGTLSVVPLLAALRKAVCSGGHAIGLGGYLLRECAQQMCRGEQVVGDKPHCLDVLGKVGLLVGIG